MHFGLQRPPICFHDDLKAFTLQKCRVASFSATANLAPKLAVGIERSGASPPLPNLLHRGLPYIAYLCLRIMSTLGRAC